jgi:hypothetical protein
VSVLINHYFLPHLTKSRERPYSPEEGTSSSKFCVVEFRCTRAELPALSQFSKKSAKLSTYRGNKISVLSVVKSSTASGRQPYSAPTACIAYASLRQSIVPSRFLVALTSLKRLTFERTPRRCFSHPNNHPLCTLARSGLASLNSIIISHSNSNVQPVKRLSEKKNCFQDRFA